MNNSVLFTCIGTSDPVRGYRDGPMLHILRYHRPKKVWILLSDEAEKNEMSDRRLEETWLFMKEHWDGYSPEKVIITTGIVDPSDQDSVAPPIENAVRRLRNENPDSELLLNLSSGTPQMKMALALLSCELGLHASGIQVKSPEGKAGTAERTNVKDFNAGDALELNEDEEEPFNRCSVPEFFSIRTAQRKKEFLALLERRDYAALVSMSGSLNEELNELVQHLYYRDILQDAEARKFAGKLRFRQFPLNLYPQRSTRADNDFCLVSEAFLSLKNMLKRDQYSLFVIRMNPFVLSLQLQLLHSELPKVGLEFSEIFNLKSNGEYELDADKLKEKNNEFFWTASNRMNAQLDRRGANLKMCNGLLAAIPGFRADTLILLQRAERLNTTLRNDLAHQLQDTTEAELEEKLGESPEQYLDKFGGLLASVYPQCDRKLFRVYDDCDEYIRANL